MLRSLYRCALRLHPPAFRQRFAGEMLSIFDQQATRFARARLMVDAFASLCRQWALRSEFWSLSASESTQALPIGIPTFYTIRPFRPRGAAVINGLLLTGAVFCLTCFAIRYSWIRVLHVRIPEVQFERSEWTPPAASPTGSFEGPTTSRAEPSTVPSVPPDQNGLSHTDKERSLSQPAPSPVKKRRRRNPVPTPPDLNAPEATSSTAAGSQPQELTNSSTRVAPSSPVIPGPATLDAAERSRVVDGAIEALRTYYVDAGVAQKMADALHVYGQSGEDKFAKDPEAFAALLTRQMQKVSYDPHVVLLYGANTELAERQPPTAQDLTPYRQNMAESNCTFERIEILPHNIGYLKFNSFPDTAVCGHTASAAMAKLNNADAIIFDLRDNPGGYANMVALIATYLFDRPTHLNDFYNRAENSTEESWTLPPIPGNKLVNKPAFILTSSTTFSAAEAFSYDLKMLERATLVGERTSGRGHMGALHRIDDQFAIRIPGIKVVNPVSKSNWENTGVEPDVKVAAADALATAEKLAEVQLRRK
jgi:hypothetical protein